MYRQFDGLCQKKQKAFITFLMHKQWRISAKFSISSFALGLRNEHQTVRDVFHLFFQDKL